MAEKKFVRVFSRHGKSLGDVELPPALADHLPSKGQYEGQLLFNKEDGKLYYWDGSKWNPPGITWEEVKNKLETEGAKNKAYDSDVDGVLDLAVIPTITRSKLEYPTEDVTFAYLAAINKLAQYHTAGTTRDFAVTADAFTDKAVKNVEIVWGCGFTLLGRVQDKDNAYAQFTEENATTADHKIKKWESASLTDLASESVDLTTSSATLLMFSISGSTLKAFREDMTTAKISATDTTFSSGAFGEFAYTGWEYNQALIMMCELLAPQTELFKPKAIIEVDCKEELEQVAGMSVTVHKPNLKQNLEEVSKLDKVSEHLKQEAKRYEILRKKGFTDEEIEALLGYIPKHQVDLASVTWGAFDHKPEHNTMLITITGGNAYTGDKAILEQIEHAKRKNLKVVKPPKDYHEAVRQYKELRKEFPEWIAGCHNYCYAVLGHEDFEAMQVADTYHGNVVDGIKPDAYKRVPEWEMRRTLAMWKERLKRAKVMKQEAQKHIEKIEKVERLGW